MSGAFIQMIIAVISVAGLIYVIAFLYKKKQKVSGLMNIMAYQPFGPRKGIAALKVGKEVLLLAVTASDFTLLKTFNESELADAASPDIDDKIKRLRRIKEEIG
ncbi:MAG: flagellar biosynthetic protein FliO [Nitrospirae bacterium]|nr:flagellar biosynthetic protein FliO [Nitrospirota bacterium]